MNTLFETFKTAVVSTAHLPEELAQQMARGADLPFMYDECSLYASRVYIFLDDDNHDWPEEIRPLMVAAKEQGYKWVEFDCDGDKVEGFQTWDW